ncbi:hypothetical protein KIPE111705_25095 [Kibdelosporangium persicum]|uniref:DUF4185 domain-containing protein n=2 Tax=Kibdelosporangium persicum TaxID=2698649 RepID=A0ABX2FCD3_9PSEU|nr:hypothetical protein [Kibdelosporangium persicum]
MSAVLLVFSGTVAGLPVRVTSNFEHHRGISLDRDCGFSAPLSRGRTFWLFCDTAWNDGDGRHFIPGSTAAVGTAAPGQIPTDLHELPTPPGRPPASPHPGGPAQFLTAPGGMRTPDGQPCTTNAGQFAASWITGITTTSPDNLLITYVDLCVTSTPKPFFIQGFGIAEYNAETNTITARTTVFSTPGAQLPATKILGSPILQGGSLYLYAFECGRWFSGVCVTGTTHVARAESWRTAANYQWYSQGRFTSDHTKAGNIIPSAGAAVSVHSFGAAGLHAILQKDLGGGFEVWQAPTPAGPWTRRSTGKVGCRGGRGNDLCRALTGHPELSTAHHMVISYFSPATRHVEAALFPW